MARLLNRSPARGDRGEARRHGWRRWQAKLTSSEAPITPYRVINEFMRVVDPAEAIVTHDSGSPREQLLPFYRATRPRSYLGWGKSHQLGTGLGLTIGAKVAAPDKFCVNFMGDAAFGMTGLDFETAVRCGVPIMHDRAEQLDDGDRDPAHEAVAREAQCARPGRELCQSWRATSAAGANGWTIRRRRQCDPAGAAADRGGQGVPAGIHHQ